MTRQILISDAIESELHKKFLWRDEIIELFKTNPRANCYAATLDIDDIYFGRWRQLLVDKKERRGEVALIVKDSKERILLHTKPFYPEGVVRIPTGGIHADEAVLDGMKRELYEETGFQPLAYNFHALLLYEFKNKNRELSFPSYIFSIKPDSESPEPADESEQISGFFWTTVAELSNVNDRLHALNTSRWGAWGKVRVIPHEIFLGKVIRDTDA